MSKIPHLRFRPRGQGRYLCLAARQAPPGKAKGSGGVSLCGGKFGGRKFFLTILALCAVFGVILTLLTQNQASPRRATLPIKYRVRARKQQGHPRLVVLALA